MDLENQIVTLDNEDPIGYKFTVYGVHDIPEEGVHESVRAGKWRSGTVHIECKAYPVSIRNGWDEWYMDDVKEEPGQMPEKIELEEE
jgi:hypothetical protein